MSSRDDDHRHRRHRRDDFDSSRVDTSGELTVLVQLRPARDMEEELRRCMTRGLRIAAFTACERCGTGANERDSRRGDRSRSRDRHSGRFDDSGGHPGNFAPGSERFPQQQGDRFPPMGGRGMGRQGGRSGPGPREFAGGPQFGNRPPMADAGRGMQGGDAAWR